MTTQTDIAVDERAQMRSMIEEFYVRASAKDFDGLMDLCTDDVQMRIPYQVPGFPSQANGKEELRKTQQSAGLYDSYVSRVVSVEPMLDPNSWLVDTKGDMIVRATGRSYRNDYHSIFRFRDGKIAEWVTYHDPIRHMVAFGRTELPAA